MLNRTPQPGTQPADRLAEVIETFVDILAERVADKLEARKVYARAGETMKGEESLPLLLRVSEVARLLSIGRSQAYKMTMSGELPGVVRIGRSVRVSSSALRRWIEESEEER